MDNDTKEIIKMVAKMTSVIIIVAVVMNNKKKRH